MKLLQLCLFSLMLVSLVSALGQTSSTIVGAGQVKNITLLLDKGDQVSATFNVTGGNEELNFSILDPAGKEILNSVKVQKGGGFTIDAGQDGAYEVAFDNSFSAEDKNVILYYTVIYVSTEQRLPDNSCYSWFFILGLLIFVLMARNGQTL